MTIGNAVPAVSRTTASPASAASEKPMTALQQRLPDDHFVDVPSRGADRAQGGEFVQVLLRARIKRLGDHDGADDHAEQGAREQRGAGAGAEQPECAAAFAKLGRGEDLDVGRCPTSTAGERRCGRHRR